MDHQSDAGESEQEEKQKYQDWDRALHRRQEFPGDSDDEDSGE